MPVRLGIQCLNPIYIPTLKTFLTLPQSLGIIGGKPHSSFYFIGYQGIVFPLNLTLADLIKIATADNNVLYMDPHFVQPAVNMEDPEFPLEVSILAKCTRRSFLTYVIPQSYQLEIPQAMPFSDIDPSLALGFLCSSQSDFDSFCAAVATVR